MSDITNPTIPLIENPEGVDAMIQALQLYLGTNLSWLDYSFGKSYKYQEVRNGKKYVIPKVYNEREEFLSLYPNLDYNSYCFFEENDSEGVLNFQVGTYNYTSSYNVSLIFFVNASQKKVTSDDYIYTEILKKDIMYILSRSLIVSDVKAIHKEYPNVFKNYTFGKEFDHFSDNYICLKFDLELFNKNSCYDKDFDYRLPSIDRPVGFPTTTIPFEANEPISAFTAVMSKDGGVEPYNPLDLNNYGSFVGVSINAANTGGTVSVATLGAVKVSFSVVEGAFYYSDNGLLTTTPPITGISHIVAKGLRNDYILIEQYEPFILQTMAKYISINSNGLRQEIQAINTSGGAIDAAKILETGADGKIHISFLPTGVGDEVITKTADEDITAGSFVHILANGNVVNADATVSREANGYIKDSVTNGNQVDVYFDGINNALSGLTIGDDYFLSTIGTISTTPITTSGQILQLIGTAISATSLSTEGLGYTNLIIRG